MEPGGGGSGGDTGSDGGSWWDSIAGSLDDFRGTIDGWIGSALSALVSPLNIIGDWMGALGEGLQQINDGLADFFDAMDVTSPNFFMLGVFTPEPGYLDDSILEIKTAAEAKFPVFKQMGDTFKSVSDSVGADKTGWKGISINLNKWGVGAIKVIDATYVNEAGPKLKFWIGAIMYFMTILYCIKKVSTIIGVGR